MTINKNTPNLLQFTRLDNGPIIIPDPSLKWEIGGVFAPAVIYENDIWKMVYRAYGDDNISRLGYAESLDGIKWQKDKTPRVIPDNFRLECDGIEDPRIVKIDGQHLITYTAYNRKRRYANTKIRILKTSDFSNFKRITASFKNHWHKNDKDGVLFPEKINGAYHMLHRIEPNIQLSVSKNLKKWTRSTTVLKKTDNTWEACKIGAGAPPIKTDLGWLLFYHGVSETKEYSMGAAILKHDSPTKTLYRLPFSLIHPETDYEKHGNIPNVVFGTSAIEFGPDYRLYYGASDTTIAVASINKNALLEALKQYPVEN
ncbi:MAG: glycosidase [Candidatus Saccharibacteria bacterium]